MVSGQTQFYNIESYNIDFFAAEENGLCNILECLLQGRENAVTVGITGPKLGSDEELVARLDNAKCLYPILIASRIASFKSC
ncbi:hypothetical protein L484_009523 [Morus notabilis]|uniref:Uncharacterized protein n=1 Tax=Morus notabilis TaxID=981085 RepID=W9R486_9ROSA|nr:hypothetical protein L484_009523 [Morus notabilis]